MIATVRLVATGMLGAVLALAVPSSSAQELDFTPRPSSQNFEQATVEPIQTNGPSQATRASAADPNRLLQVPLSDVGREAIRGGEVRWSVLVAAGGLIFTLGVGLSLYRRLTRQPGDPAPGEAFVAHARRIGLTWREALLLVRVARGAKLPTPLTLLVASGTLYHHGRQFAAGFSMNRRERVHRTLSGIHRKAFPHTLRIPGRPPETPSQADFSPARGVSASQMN